MNRAAKVIDEYLISIKPSVDMTAWKKATGKLKEDITDEFAKIFTDGSPESIKQFSKNIEKSSEYLAMFGEAVDYAASKARQFADQASDISNRFISQSSLFVDTNTRDIMGKFGVGSTTAQSINAASNHLGISTSDYARLTQGQREAFAELMQYYQAGIERIDPTKLQQFNEATQQYQLNVAKFHIDTELRFMEILAESGSLPQLLDTFGDAMENITAILGSDAFKTGADVFIGLLNGILEFVTMPLEGLGKLFGAGKSEGGNTTNNITVNNSSYGGISDSDIAYDIGLQVQNALTR
jgi:hypothetical protein